MRPSSLSNGVFSLGEEGGKTGDRRMPFLVLSPYPDVDKLKI